jgi:putative ABC transport system permease protein
MSAVGRMRAWVRAVVRRDQMERQMRDEMSAHIEQAAERFVARGMSRHEALIAAQREFGPVGLLQEHARDARGGQLIDNLRRDVKYAFRYYARTPLTTITIILTLTLGIGFSSAVFSVLNGILTRPAPGVPNDPALVKIRGSMDVRPYDRSLSYPELAAYASLTTKFESVVGWGTSGVVVGTGDPALGVASARGLFVTPNYFTTLGVRLAAGRSFDQTRFEQRYPPELTTIVSYGLAMERFGSPQAALGKQIAVNEVPVTVIGVAPQRFNGPVVSGEARNLWLPMSAWQSVANVRDEIFTDPTVTAFEAFARLKPGVLPDEATSAVKLVAARADAESRALVKRASTFSADVTRLRGLIPNSYEQDLGPIGLMATLVAILILLVCTTTVSSLLVGSAVARRYEIGVRLALGASRARVIRQLLAEISVLALIGAALGLWVFGALSRIIEVAQDGFDVTPNWQTIVFTVAYTIVAATLCGLSPALHATRAGLSEVLKDSAASVTRKSRLQRTLVIGQIAIAQPLMVLLAAVTTNVFNQIPTARTGTVRDRVLIAELDTYAGYNLKLPDRIPAVVRALEQLPGVVSVQAVGTGLGWMSFDYPTQTPVASGEPSRPAARAVTYDVPAGYFRMVEAPIVRGREFVSSDTIMSTAVPLILSESLATALFNSTDPIGQRLRRIVPEDAAGVDMRPKDFEVVGLVRMVRDSNSLEYPSELPPAFVPYRREREGRVVIRTAAPAEPLIPSVMAVLRKEAPTIPVRKLQTLAEGDRVRRDSRLGAFGAISACGTLVLVLASIGLYAMVSVAVGQRRREIGVRVALGARASQVVAMFFMNGLKVALIGLLIGLPLSIVGLALLRSQVEMTGLNIAGVAVIVAVAVTAVAAFASWFPSRRAARVNPIVALRSE